VSLALYITCAMSAVDSRNVIHAVKARPPSKRKTYDTACGKRARLIAFPIHGRPGAYIACRWPLYVSQAREWGYERCRDCMVASPGRPERVELVDGAA
jgi:hypothetical protein